MGFIEYKPALKSLIENLDHPNIDIRIKTVNALGLYGNPKVLPILVNHLEQSEGRYQEKIIEAIYSHGMEGIFTLIRLLFKNRNGTYSHPEYLEKYLLTHGGN